MNLVAGLLARLQDESTRSYVHFRYSANTICIIGSISMFALLCGELAFVEDRSIPSLIARAAAIGAWLSLFVLVRRDVGGSKNLKLWWVGVLVFCVPFAPLFSYFMYAGDGPLDQSARYFLLISYIISLCVYTQLMNSFIAASIGLVVGTLAAVVAFTVITDKPPIVAIDLMFVLVGQQLTAVLIGSVTNRNPEIAKHDSYHATRGVGRMIARDLKAALEAIISHANIVGNSLPAMVWAHGEASRLGLVDELSARQVEVISTSPKDIEKEAHDAETLIDMLLVNIAQEPVYGQSFETLDAFDLVRSAADRYPYANDHERSLVAVEPVTNFVIAGPRLLLHHVIYNLIKNALYYVQKAGKGSIVITITAADTDKAWEGGTLSVKDTGPGIPASNLSAVFRRFYSTTEPGRGSGIGLNFCKTVIDNLGGQIKVDSEEGEWTRFDINFPIAHEPEFTLSEPSKTSVKERQ